MKKTLKLPFIKSTSTKLNKRFASGPKLTKKQREWNKRAKETNSRIIEKWSKNA